MPEVRIGCSGFNYDDWKENFYPSGLPQRKWLNYYSSIFSTVELNVTFYRLPLPKTFDAWYAQTPPDFVFSLKGSRFITHVKRLLEPKDPLELFFERALRLREKLRVVLWQFPPSFTLHITRLEKFLTLLSRYTISNTLEFRHESWITTDVITLCKDYRTSLCMADWPAFIDDIPVTADFVYVRRHGRGGNYANDYSSADLERDARRIRAATKNGKDVFVYFNNDVHGYAPKNAQELKALLK